MEASTRPQMRHAWGLDLDTEVDEGTGVLDVCSSPLTTIDRGGLPQLLFWSLITFSATKHGRICVRCVKNQHYKHQSPCSEYGGWSPRFTTLTSESTLMFCLWSPSCCMYLTAASCLPRYCGCCCCSSYSDAEKCCCVCCISWRARPAAVSTYRHDSVSCVRRGGGHKKKKRINW